jgi:hypothetical protein
MAAVGILSARLLATRQEVQATDSPNSNSALSGILPPIADLISSRDGFIGGNFLENVKHIHPPISNSECKKEAEGGLDDAACCASYSWLDYVRNGSLGWTGQILRLVTVGIWVGVGGYLIWLSYQ